MRNLAKRFKKKACIRAFSDAFSVSQDVVEKAYRAGYFWVAENFEKFYNEDPSPEKFQQNLQNFYTREMCGPHERKGEWGLPIKAFRHYIDCVSHQKYVP